MWLIDSKWFSASFKSKLLKIQGIDLGLCLRRPDCTARGTCTHAPDAASRLADRCVLPDFAKPEHDRTTSKTDIGGDRDNGRELSG
jgi:hypothetical protein